MAYAENAKEVEQRVTITTAIERAAGRLHTLAEHAEEVGDHLYGAAPRPASATGAAIPPPSNVMLSLSRLSDQIDRLEGAMARIDKGLR